MISRSSTNAANHLRRTKSSQIVVQRRSSTSSLIDSAAAEQHAIVAATTAYEKALGKENISGRDAGQSPEFVRFRSNRTRRSDGEGSHFDASRTPRRSSSKRLSNASHVVNDYPRSRRGTVSSVRTDPRDGSHVKVDNERQSNSSRFVDDSIMRNSATPFKPIRKSKSMCSTFNHIRATSIDTISFVRTPRQAPSAQPSDKTVANIQEQNETVTGVIPPVPPITSSGAAIYNVDDKLQKARDQHFQNLNKRKLRQRTSFMLTPFKKRHDTTTLSGTSSIEITYDDTVPPPISLVRREERKTSDGMKTAGSFRNKIRKVFRRSSMTPLELPVQHVEATRSHYGDLLSRQSPERRPLPPPRTDASNSSSRAPNGSIGNSRSTSPIHSVTSTEARSRVTSWADSSIAGTTNSRESKSLAVIREDAPQSPPSTRGQKYSSVRFFCRSRKSSASNASETPRPPNFYHPVYQDPFHEDAPEPLQPTLKRSGTVYDNLPSQSRRISANSSLLSNATRPTIRAVTDCNRDLPSRTCSSRLVSGSCKLLIQPDRTSSGEESPPRLPAKKVRNRLHKARTDEMVTKPTAEQIASRVERSNDRWKQSLEGGNSLFYPHSPKSASPDRHHRASKKLPSPPEPETPTPEVYFAAIHERPSFRSAAVLSPSVYSQDTDSPPKRLIYDSVVSHETNDRNTSVGSAVVIPSQTAAKYPVGSSKKEFGPRLTKTSRDWKAWLSKEVQDLETPPADHFMLSNDYVQPHAASRHCREHAQIVDGDDDTFGSGENPTNTSISIVVPSIQPRPVHQSRQTSSMVSVETSSSRPSSHGRSERPRLMDKPSSRMNERFPFIETGRPSSRTSRRSSQKLSPPVERPPVPAKKANSNSSSMLSVPVPKPRHPLHRPMSTSSFRRSNSSLAQYKTNSTSTESTTQNNQRPRPMSQFPRPSVPDSGATSNNANNNSHKRSTSALKNSGTVLYKPLASPLTPAGPSMDTDPTLAAIFKGPYCENTASPARRSLYILKDPSHPQMIREQSSPLLREISSILREGSQIFREASSLNLTENSSFNFGFKENSSTSSNQKENSSPVRSSSEDAEERSSLGNGTPTRGQILAEQFLKDRRYRSEVR